MIVVVGSGPLPAERGRRHEAAGMRAWQLATAIAEAGLPCRLLLRRLHEGEPAAAPGPFAVETLEAVELEEPAALRARLDALRPDAVVGAATYPSYLAARSGSAAPLWVDLNGDPMAEAQAASAATGAEAPLLDAWWMLSWCLRRGDRFSVVSSAQRLALLGQLGAYGRRVPADGAGLVAVLPEAYPEPAADAAAPRSTAEPLVLSSGSFNGWTDGATLLAGLALAMAGRPGLRAAVTGGPVAGLTEEAWRRFLAARERLPEAIRDRVEVHGWVDSARLDALESRALCGVVAELPVVERELGGSNRSLRWMARGVPVVVTGLSELGRASAAAGAALPYRAGDAGSLAAAIGALADDAALAARTARAALDWLRTERSVAATTAPLVAWARAPRPAADRAAGGAARLAARHAEMLRDIAHLEGR